MKINWKTSPAPTGKWAAFEKRAWPSAEFDDGQCAASISADVEYLSGYRSVVLPFELTVRVSVPKEDGGWRWAKLNRRANSIAQAKDLVKLFYATHPQYIVKAK